MITLTHSDIAQFLKCRRSWQWGYIEDRTPPDRTTGALALGSRVHLCLEKFYLNGEDPVATHDKIVADTAGQLELNGAPSWELDQFYEDAIVGRHCCATYMDWLEESGADAGLIVDGVESMIETPILDGRVMLRGKVDVRFRRESDGALIINDFKTTGKAINQITMELDRSYQAYVYAAIQRRMTPDDYVIGGMYRIIKKVTRRQYGNTYVEERLVPGMARSQANVEKQIFAICDEMASILERREQSDMDDVFYMSPGEHCVWCAFKNPCTIANENPAAAADMLEDQYTSGRHRRYDSTPDMTKEEGDLT